MSVIDVIVNWICGLEWSARDVYSCEVYILYIFAIIRNFSLMFKSHKATQWPVRLSTCLSTSLSVFLSVCPLVTLFTTFLYSDFHRQLQSFFLDDKDHPVIPNQNYDGPWHGGARNHWISNRIIDLVITEHSSLGSKRVEHDALRCVKPTWIMIVCYFCYCQFQISLHNI